MNTIYYCVLDVVTGAKRYRGTSLQKAAEALVPGTILGRGTAQCGATLAAQQEARRLRRGAGKHEARMTKEAITRDFRGNA